MKPYLQSICQLAFLSLCALITVKESGGTFVPGRCLCPRTQPGVTGPLKELTVYRKSPSCDKVTVIVTQRRDNNLTCINPDAPLGKRLIHCWNRAHELGLDVKLCLRRRWGGRGGQRQRLRQRSRGKSRKTAFSNSQ